MPGAIVFDLDGTLIHSAPDIVAAANRMLGDFGHPPLPVRQLTSFIGHGIPHLVQRVIETCGLDPTLHPAMTERMVAQYSADPAGMTLPYPGVVAMLEQLRGNGHRLGVCTNKLEGLSRQILDALDLAQHFDVVVGGDTLPVRKPDPAPLRFTFVLLTGAPLLFVGDSEVDAETAAAAGMDFALFTAGYRRRAVEDLPHRFAFRRHDLLPDIVAALGAG